MADAIEDHLFTFDAGVNSGISPLLLQKNQLFSAFNATVRGTLVRPRPPFLQYTFSDAGKAIVASALAKGPFQGAGYFSPDNASECLVASIGGVILRFDPVPATRTCTVTDISIPLDPNPATQPQVWMWQSEKWLVIQDGLSNPIFYDGTTSVRSNYNAPVNYSTTTAAPFTIPAVGSAANITFTSTVNLLNGDIITIQNYGQFVVNDISGSPVVNVTNLNAAPVGQVVNSPVTISWSHKGTQLPPGRMGAYVMGRNWVVLVDGRQFIASDITGGASGTASENYRDAVLNVTENSYLQGGGNFSVPGNVGEIRFIKGMSTPDVSLGQGPVMVGTHNTVFSCQAPVDRTTWSDLTNPILTVSMIGNGGQGQWNTINVNSDLLMRSIDGIRSFSQARRDYNTPGNTPISREVDSILSKDSPDILPYGSAVYFDNRLLMTTGTVANAKGNYFTGIVPLNFDPISTLRGKAPSVYDSQQWVGLNTLQLIAGVFDGIERSFSFTLDLTSSATVQVWEILKSSDPRILDDGTERIVWGFETAQLFNQSTVQKRTTLTLWDGEIHVDDLQGEVGFQIFYRPDQYPCWIPWYEWTECAGNDGDTSKPQYRPRMGFGKPSHAVCNLNTQDAMPEGYSFQVKAVIKGHCRVVGLRLRSSPNPQRAFAPQSCCP